MGGPRSLPTASGRVCYLVVSDVTSASVPDRVGTVAIAGLALDDGLRCLLWGVVRDRRSYEEPKRFRRQKPGDVFELMSSLNVSDAERLFTSHEPYGQHARHHPGLIAIAGY